MGYQAVFSAQRELSGAGGEQWATKTGAETKSRRGPSVEQLSRDVTAGAKPQGRAGLTNVEEEEFRLDVAM